MVNGPGFAGGSLAARISRRDYVFISNSRHGHRALHLLLPEGRRISGLSSSKVL